MTDVAAAHAAPRDRLYRRPGRFAVYLIIAAALLAGDLYVKHWAFNVMPDQPVPVGHHVDPGLSQHTEPYTIVPGVLEFQLVQNHGAVFGLGHGQRWILIGITLMAIAAVGVVMGLSDRRSWLLHACLVLVLAGAVGNLYDRAVYGVVRDMLHFFPGRQLPLGLSWPGFIGGQRAVWPWVSNVADVYLNLGIWPLVARTLWTGRAEPAAATDTPAAS